MTIVISALQYLGYVLIFPGFLFCFLAGMLLCGIDRKLVAKMQKRVGPPILQPFYDFFKLCGKETIIPASASKTTFLIAPLVGLAALVVIQLFIPVFSFSAFSGMADVIVILYLLLIPAMSIILGGAASGSPYAGVGLSREMVTIISCELPLVLVLLAVAKTVGSALGTGLCFSLSDIAAYQAMNGSLITKLSMIPAAAAMLLIIPGETGNHPFDAAEAETEICEGLLAEYSGAPLGVFKLSHAIKMLTLTSLFVALFLGGLGTGIVALDGIILFLLCVVLTAVSISFVHAITARLKIEQIFKFYWTLVTGLALISLVLAWYGLEGGETMFKKLIQESMGKSPWLFHINAGSCNGCDIELVSVLTPRYDAERLGFKLTGTPRHADIVVVTGPVTKQSLPRVLRAISQVPEPRCIVTMGSCPQSGNVFRGSYSVAGPLSKYVHVDVDVAGCAPKPEAVIDGLALATQILKEKRGQMK